MKHLWLIFLMISNSAGCNYRSSSIAPDESVSRQSSENSILHFLDSLHFHSKEVFIFIDKSDYLLYVMKDSVFLHQYPVVLGTHPLDDKRMQGDGCTPEGIFSIRDQYPHDSWSKFIWIDYPTRDSWGKFNASKSDGKIPDNADIGGEIGIHGVPKGMDYLISSGRNWTAGCISMKTEDVKAVYDLVRKGSSVIIRK
jgi:murein L,D-transpeptidase YafK